MKSSTGSWNARWRRESGGGNADQPEADNLRVSVEKTEHEKLNKATTNMSLVVNPLTLHDALARLWPVC
ncbi:MAG TPA: hypothetical protein P5186_18225, partial [Candidatus Paceibacterota bacterium]|nr:hypothetical protein [Candidatus Paceibacterota bacterium]